MHISTTFDIIFYVIFEKGLITFFFFYYYDEVDPLVAKAFHIVCDEKLINDGYCDISEYITARKSKDDFLSELQKEKSPLVSLYRKPYPKYNNAKDLWYDFTKKDYSNFSKINTISLTEAKAIVNWVYHAYNTPIEREKATIEMLPEFNNNLDVGELAFAYGIIYKRHDIDICVISSFEEFISTIQSIQSINRTLYFRGHSNYTLLPSIMRKTTWLQHECDLYNETIIECPDAFKRCVTHLDYLVEMQHYGLPTRLLDVTKNPLVALYFACTENETAQGEFIVFDVETENIKYPKSDTVSILSSLPLFKKSMKDDLLKWAADPAMTDFNFNLNATRLLHEIKLEKPAFKDEIKRHDIMNCFFVQAEKKNARIIKQDGAFIICGLFSPKTNVINQYRYKEFGKVQVYIIDKDAKSEIVDQLNKMSINRAQLFPEIQDVTTHIKNKY